MQEDTIPMAWWIRGIPMTRVPRVLPTGDPGQGDANRLPTNKSASCSLRRWILTQDVRLHSVIRTLSIDVTRSLRGYPQIGLVCSIRSRRRNIYSMSTAIDMWFGWGKSGHGLRECPDTVLRTHHLHDSELSIRSRKLSIPGHVKTQTGGTDALPFLYKLGVM